MKRLTNIAAILLLVGSLAACKSKDEKNAEAVESAREKVVDKQEEVKEQIADKNEAMADKQDDVDKAKAELNQARIDFVNAVDKRLADLDARITAAKTNKAIDQGKVATLRAEAAALRARAADEAQPFVDDTRNAFDRLVTDIEAELDRK